jgi:G3E family GTPase
MVKVDLITGFLGSGKTTFLKKYATYLMKKGEHIGIIENDFGAVNVDMMLLKDLEGDKCELEMVSGGCDYDCHRRRFKTKLIAFGMSDLDRVIVEPSGIYDVEEFFDVLYEEPLDKWYSIGNVITIVDAGLEDDLSYQSEYLLASQLADCGAAVVSKVAAHSKYDIDKTIDHINNSLSMFSCKRKLGREIIIKDWEQFTDEDFEQISHSGYSIWDIAKPLIDKEKDFDSVFYMNVKFTSEGLKKSIDRIFNDEACGDVKRIKGFIKNDDGTYVEINATREKSVFVPIADGQEIIIVIGEHLNKERLDCLLLDRDVQVHE